MGRTDYTRAWQLVRVDGHSRSLDVIRHGDGSNRDHKRVGNDLLVLPVRPVDRSYGVNVRAGSASTRHIFLRSGRDLGDVGVEFL